MAVEPEPERLGCGRLLDEIWDTIDHPPDAHQRTCEDCQRSRASLAELADVTERSRRLGESDPSQQPSPRVKTAIMAVARAEVRRGRRLPLEQAASDDSSTGVPVTDLTVSDLAIARVARRMADSVRSVRARRIRVHTAAPVQAIRSAPAGVALVMRVSVDATVSIPAVVEILRRRITTAIIEQVGVEVVSIDIVVEDVYES